jgi:RNA polymerase sigma-70 factor (ECF subfamily)
MDDNRIIDLYFTRDERAIEHTRAKYDKLLYHVSYKILHSNPDAEECVDDTYMKAWGTMPPERPNILSAFLCKITRNLSLNRYMQNKSRSRIMTTEKVFEEIAECVPDTAGPISEDIELRNAVNGFLESLSEIPRKIFVKRYFLFFPFFLFPKP